MVGPFLGSGFFFSKWFEFVVSYDSALSVSDQNLLVFVVCLAGFRGVFMLF